MLTTNRNSVASMLVPVRLFVCAGLVCCCFPVSGQEGPSDLDVLDSKVRAMGITARLNPIIRDRVISEIAAALTSLGKTNEEGLHSIQSAFQYALLLSCDRGIYETLKPETIEAVDNALESLFTIDDINRDLRWEPLVYVYGFFNHDATVAEIIKVRDSIKALPDDTREDMYPVYPHGFDALVKPLAMGHLTDASQTAEALNAAIPMLKKVIQDEAKPGRAFHPPSHAIIVIAPIYDRWADTEGPEGVVVRELLGTRDEFVALLQSRVVGGVPAPRNLPKFHYRFYAYSGQYFANAFARIDARETIDALKLSLELYEENIGYPSLIAYTKRALVVLGDLVARAELEVALSRSSNARAVDTLAWICRNAQGEGKAYAEQTLASEFGCDPEDALDSYLNRKLAVLAGTTR
jgi:hypothetical protein